MKKTITRDYQHEDEALLTLAQVMHANISEDAALFTVRFPWLDAAYIAAFQAEINIAGAVPLDHSVVSTIKMLAADVEAAVTTGIEALQRLNMYARLAYASQPAKQRAFGQSAWQRARSSPQKMIFALHDAHEAASEPGVKADLFSKGMTQADIDNLDNIAEDLIVKHGQLKRFKRARPVATQSRIEIYNALWDRMRTIATCALLVFQNNPAKVKQYYLYPSGTDAKTDVTVLVSHAGNSVESATVELTNTELVPQATDNDGRASFNSINMPAILNIEVAHPALGRVKLDGKSIKTGKKNTIEVAL